MKKSPIHTALFLALPLALSACGNPISTLLEKAQENYQKRLAAAPYCKMSSQELRGTVKELKTDLEEIHNEWALLKAYAESPDLEAKDFSKDIYKVYGTFCGIEVTGSMLYDSFSQKSSLKSDADYASTAKAQVEKARAVFNENPNVCRNGDELENSLWFGSDADELLPKLTTAEKAFKASATPNCDEIF